MSKSYVKCKQVNLFHIPYDFQTGYSTVTLTDTKDDTLCRFNMEQQSHLLLHINVELANTLQGKLLLLHQDTNGFTHELLGDLQHISGHGSRQQHHLVAK